MSRHNYTQMPIGTLVDNCEIQQCPYCGKPGLAERIGISTFYIHLQAWEHRKRTPNPS
jgi:hypothetical protein